MKHSLNLLKPKANKLHAFVTNWKIPNKEKKKELAKHLESFLKDERYPKPIRSFFQLPLYKELLANLHEGRISSRTYDEEERFEYLPPKEIHTLQVLIEAFHSLVHLDYFSEQSDNPFVQAKIHAKNILEYVTVIHRFIPYEGNLVNEILEYLIASVKGFALEFQVLVLTYPDAFNTELKKTFDKEVYSNLLNLDKDSFDIAIRDEWLNVFVELNIDPKLSQEKEKLRAIAISNMHKLINQTSAILQNKRFFAEKNAPRYTPYDIYDRFATKLDERKGDTLSGQAVNEIFYDLFWLEKYEIIEAKQEGVNSKLSDFETQLRVSRESIEYLMRNYSDLLPDSLSSHIQQMLSPIPFGFSLLGKPNFLAIQVVLGFYNLHCDYLIDLLGAEGDNVVANPECINLCYEIIPMMISFLENYYYLAPQTSFAIVKDRLEHLYQGDEQWEKFTKDEAKERVKAMLTHFLPNKELDMEHFEIGLEKILVKLEKFPALLPTDSCEYRLFMERLYNLAHADVPSIAHMWYSMGEFFALFQIILMQMDPHFLTSISAIAEKIESEPFIKILLHGV